MLPIYYDYILGITIEKFIMSSNQLTVDEFKSALPKQMKTTINQNLIDQINNSISDPTHMAEYRDQVISYTAVLKEGKFKIEQYLEAVMYVSYKIMGHTNLEAFSKTFPGRYKNYLSSGTSSKDIASYVSSYNKNKLVNLVFERTLIPTHVLNADVFQKAINVQASLMTDSSVSAKVRSDAANSLMTHLKAPETKKVELDIGVKEDTTINELHDVISVLAAKQKQSIELGLSNAKEVAHSVVIEAEVEVIDES